MHTIATNTMTRACSVQTHSKPNLARCSTHFWTDVFHVISNENSKRNQKNATTISTVVSELLIHHVSSSQYYGWIHLGLLALTRLL